MKKINLSILLLILLCHCQELRPCEEKLCITDSRLVHEWEIFQQCQCYYQGGDFLWTYVDQKYSWKFSDQCEIIETGDTDSNCNSGNYLIENDKISIKWLCSNSNTTSSDYSYSISQNGDTLTVKGQVDEGFIGQKFIKKK